MKKERLLSLNLKRKAKGGKKCKEDFIKEDAPTLRQLVSEEDAEKNYSQNTDRIIAKEAGV